jgi:hypothetical protein
MDGESTYLGSKRVLVDLNPDQEDEAPEELSEMTDGNEVTNTTATAPSQPTHQELEDSDMDPQNGIRNDPTTQVSREDVSALSTAGTQPTTKTDSRRRVSVAERWPMSLSRRNQPKPSTTDQDPDR